jgi:hypothetical protein
MVGASKQFNDMLWSNDSKYMYCCEICYNNPEVTLFNCFKMGQRSGPGNTTFHVQKVHNIYGSDDIPVLGQICGSKRSSPSLSSHSASAKKRACQHQVDPVAAQILFESPASRTKSKTRDSSGFGNKISMGSTISTKTTTKSAADFFQQALTKGSANVWQEYNFLLHQFVNNNNIPARVVTVSTLCPEFFYFVHFIQARGNELKGICDKTMKRRQFAGFKKGLFECLLSAFAMYIWQSREEFYKMLKKPVPFISIGHDIWDSSQKEVLGVTVFFYDPVVKRCFAFPVGLKTVLSKKAEPTADQTLLICQTAGMEKSDLFKAANDTTNTALKVGRLLTVSGERGTYGMHEGQGQLAFEHATGKKVRKRGNKVVDHFDDFVKLHAKSLKAAKYLMEKKSKGRFLEYIKLMKSEGPNSTRLCGTQFHFESMIRARWNLYNYWHKTPKATTVENDDFTALADVSAVFPPMKTLIMPVQSDIPGAQSYTFIYFYRTFVLYWYQKLWWVPGVDKHHNTDVETHWNVNAKFPARSFQGGVPRLAGVADVSYNSGDRLVGMMRKDLDKMDCLAKCWKMLLDYLVYLYVR